ncbi:MAG: hypothetical protein DRK00_03345 [Thermoprotei archaeon]|nr:MAG: hypothetical protein DRK00_03345 [Thermoprotei archaeon]
MRGRWLSSRLFEEARYSGHPVTEDARREALQCLTAIKE